ncbi:MAG TPA: hypothetical protein ENI23_11730 [bacterium]|nr:hypothetical protein [bacterium]
MSEGWKGIKGVPLRALLDWYMCSDPWPGGDQDAITAWLDKVCKMRGYKDLIEAYHFYQRRKLEKRK